MAIPWRAALCAAPTIIALAGSAWLGHHARADRARTTAESGEADVMVTLSPADEDRMHRLALKHEAAADLLDGRMTFDEALARFWEVTTASPESLDNLREVGCGATDQERVVHQLVAFARVQAARNHKRYDAALARVEQEANSHTARTVSQ